MAGVVASIAAARLGARVLLIEKYGFVGGMATAGLVDTIPPISRGIGLEVQRRMEDIGCIGREMEFWASWEPEGIKRVCLEMLEAAGVEVLLHTFVVDSILEGLQVRGVIVENKSGRQGLVANVLIDSTGDGDIAMHAGAGFLFGENGITQPMTLMFNLRNVDKEKARRYLNPSIKLFLKEAIERKEVTWEIGFEQYQGQPGVNAKPMVQKDEVTVWGGVIDRLSGINANDLTQAEIIARRHVIRLVQVLRQKVPGFENAVVSQTASQVGVRESRRIVGDYLITIDDLKEGKKFQDWVAFVEYGKWKYWIPYSILLPKGLESLLLAGRCVSASREVLQMAGLREVPNAMITGEAAGVAAAVSVKMSVAPRQLDIATLQRQMISNRLVPLLS
jgi:hypothetical protein